MSEADRLFEELGYKKEEGNLKPRKENYVYYID